jgi:hypothetical protein
VIENKRRLTYEEVNKLLREEDNDDYVLYSQRKKPQNEKKNMKEENISEENCKGEKNLNI